MMASRDDVAGLLGDADEREPGVQAGPERDKVRRFDGEFQPLVLAGETDRRAVAVDVADLRADGTLDAAGALGVVVVESENSVVDAVS